MNHTLYPTNDSTHKHHRRQLRQEQTMAEKVLWQELRAGRMGCKWRRQFGIGRFIVDFCCFELTIAIELDGPIHDEQKEYDLKRDHELEQRGFKVIRYKNDEVLFDRERVLREIKETCEKRREELSKIKR